MGSWDILLGQHRQLQACLARLKAAAPEQQGRLTGELDALLRLHARLEEPLLSWQGPSGARAAHEELLTLRELAEELLEQSPGSEAWWARLIALEDVLAAHVSREQSQPLSRRAPAPEGPQTAR